MDTAEHASVTLFEKEWYVYVMIEHPDNKYINALLNNDQGLIKELYQKCFGKIKYFVLDNHGTANDAWDILQEAMLSIYYRIKRGPFTLTCPFDAFIYIVCRNMWIKELRKRHAIMVTIDNDSGYAIKEDDD